MAQNIIAVLNQKGGVGKTTLVCHLAHAARESGRRVLVVDFDTQANASHTLAGDLPPIVVEQNGSLRVPAGAADELFSAPSLSPLVTDQGIDLLFGHQYLDQVDADFSSMEALVARSSFLRSLPHEVVIFDTPPAIGIRHLAPLLWSHTVLTPIEPNEYSVLGLNHTLLTIEAARSHNPGLRHVVLINRLKPSSKAHHTYIDAISRVANVRGPYLADRVAVSAALGERRPVWRHSRADRRLRDTWRELCLELVA